MQRRFGPLFWTQFCGAFNDNLYKNALVILITFKAYVEMGTFLAILLGTILGRAPGQHAARGGYLISAAVMAFAAMGWLSSLRIPSLPPIAQAQPIQLNIFKSTVDILRICRRTRSVFLSILNIPLTGRIFRDVKVIPIAGSRENASILDAAFDRISKELRAGEIVCIYPEGQLTHDGDLSPFRNGIERIIQRDPVPVIPTALRGLWGSLFSRKHRRWGQKLRHNKLWSRVELQIGQPIAPEKVNAPLLQEKVASLLARVG